MHTKAELNDLMSKARALTGIQESSALVHEALKALTRGASGITQASMHAFIDGLDVSDALKTELKQITPHNYTGVLGDF